jgi:Flp pilus assembly protein TadD
MAYNNRGVARQQKGDLEGAISDFGRAIAANPRHAEAYANRGIALLRLGKKAEAQRDLSQSLALKPGLKPFIEQSTAGQPWRTPVRQPGTGS